MVLFFIATVSVSGYMLLVERRYVMTKEEWYDSILEEDTDCIMVLGCSVLSSGAPSPDLQGRLDKAIELYQIVPHKILVSGDHSDDGYYNEVKVMKNYLVNHGIPSEDIFSDHYGYSTYDSIYRAYKNFGIHRITIVTQEFHIYRAVFLARAIGMETIGVPSGEDAEDKQSVWNLREVFARDKDFLASLFWSEPAKTGDQYDINGNGNITNDR